MTWHPYRGTVPHERAPGTRVYANGREGLVVPSWKGDVHGGGVWVDCSGGFHGPNYYDAHNVRLPLTGE